MSATGFHCCDFFLLKVCQPFDPGGFLRRAMISGHLTFTIPWLVEFCSMMDQNACKLEIYQSTVKMLSEVYRYM